MVSDLIFTAWINDSRSLGMCGNNLLIYYTLSLPVTSKKTTLLFKFCTPLSLQTLEILFPLQKWGGLIKVQTICNKLYIHRGSDWEIRKRGGCLNQVFVVQAYYWKLLDNKHRWDSLTFCVCGQSCTPHLRSLSCSDLLQHSPPRADSVSESVHRVVYFWLPDPDIFRTWWSSEEVSTSTGISSTPSLLWWPKKWGSTFQHPLPPRPGCLCVGETKS